MHQKIDYHRDNKYHKACQGAHPEPYGIHYGTSGVHLVVRAEEEDFRMAVGSLPNISRCEKLSEDVGEGLTAYAVYSSDGAEIRDRLFALCAARGFALFELGAIQKTLEDVFIALTGEEGSTI